MKRNVYLHTLPISEAIQRIRHRLARDLLVAQEKVLAHEALGRILAEPVSARFSSPTFHGAAMDGYAVRAAQTFAARPGRPVRLTKGQDAIPVNTGTPLPHSFDAVLMVEHVTHETTEEVATETAVFPYQHVRRIGEDIVATELLLPRGRQISAYDVAALLTAGIWEVTVWQQPRLCFLPTGDEVLDFRTQPQPTPGAVVESNSQLVAGLLRPLGCLVDCLPPVPDQPAALEQAVRQALSQYHAVAIGAGSSAGAKDYSRMVMERVGEVLVHGLDIMPGKPSLLGVAEGKLMVGIPGYPVSAAVCTEEVLIPILCWLGRIPQPQRPTVSVELARSTPSKLGTNEYLRLAIGRVGQRLVGMPLSRGAGLISTLVRAQGVSIIPAASEGMEAGAQIPVRLLTPESELERTVIIVGSHDNLLDLLADALMAQDEPLRLASSHVGSMGGIAALREGRACLAGMHLFDPETEDFNFPFLAKYLPGVEVECVNLAIRHQGLMVAKGNPLGIRGIEDLTRPEVHFVNRQRGSGTRILLDHALHRAGLDPHHIQGYDHEEFTHMAVAANVHTGAASCGLGILAAARALNLDFIPLARERYDLVFRTDLKDWRIQRILEVLQSPEFQSRIARLGGYETHLTGHFMRPGQGLAI
jgi:putative molybdopterin biosynthesis protein